MLGSPVKTRKSRQGTAEFFLSGRANRTVSQCRLIRRGKTFSKPEKKADSSRRSEWGSQVLKIVRYIELSDAIMGAIMAFTNPTSEAVSVELPRAHPALYTLMGISWAALGSYHVFFPRGRDRYDRLEDVLMGIPYIIMGAVWVWQALARRRISVSQNELRYEITGLGLTRIRRYALEGVRNLRLDARRTFFRYPRVVFDRDDGPKFKSDELGSGIPRNLLDPIYERFPQLAPGD
jgi:hypothetical protein